MTSTQAPTFTLYRGWPKQDQIVWSPFVTKVEFRLRLSSIKYTAGGGSTSQSPKGKIPYIKVNYGDKSDTFSDSTLIHKRLVEEGLLDSLNTSLSPAQKLADLAVRSLLEEKLYFYHMHERWIQNYYAHRDHILSHLSMPMRTVVGLIIYRNITSTLHGQGTGRLTEEEIDMYRCEIWQTIENQLLEAKKNAQNELFWILGGSEATEADCTLFGFITSVLIASRRVATNSLMKKAATNMHHSCPRSQEIVRSCPTVMEYAERIFQQHFRDYRHWDS